MRILIAGEQTWNCHGLAEAILRRLLGRHGPDITSALGGAPGVDWAFSRACERLGIGKEVHLPDFAHVGDYRYANTELIRRGAELCLIVHRHELDKASRDLAEKAILAGIPAWLIDSERGKARRVGTGDAG